MLHRNVWNILQLLQPPAKVICHLQVKENKYYQATYSRISPYADPAFESIEPYVEAAHSHLKPVSLNGKA